MEARLDGAVLARESFMLGGADEVLGSLSDEIFYILASSVKCLKEEEK